MTENEESPSQSQTRYKYWLIFASIVSVIGGAVSAVCAVIAISQTSSTLKETWSSGRPYFILSQTLPPIRKLDNGNWRVVFRLENIGDRPAKEFRAVCQVFTTNLTTPSNEWRAASNGSFVKGLPIGYDFDYAATSTILPIYYAVAFRYKDGIDNTQYEDEVAVYRWGITDGIPDASLSIVDNPASLSIPIKNIRSRIPK